MSTLNQATQTESKYLHNVIDTISEGQQDLLRVIPELEASLAVFLRKPIKPSPAKALSRFGLLPLSHQQQVTNVLESQLAFIKEAVTCGLDAYNELALVRMAMRKLSLFADENSLNNVASTDVLEILGPDQTQVYRSYSCFALCNYSIAELVSYPWYELYERPSWVEERLISLGYGVLEGKVGYVDLEKQVPPYVLQEKLTEEKAAFQVQEKFYARMLSRLSQKNYVLSVKQITPVDTASPGKISFL